MNQEDRKKVFWLLKKYSSYTAWAALGEAYAKFVEVWEYAMKHADYTTHADWYKRILDGQIAFEKGLPLLREGQRSVFRNTSTGYFKIGASKLNFIDRIMDPEEFDFDWMKNKDEVLLAYKTLDECSQISGFVFERPSPDVAAPLGRNNVFSQRPSLYNFPARLPDVPSPTDTTVNTGKAIPITGVWEPEWEIPAGFIRTLTGSQPPLEKGCMNYLLAGSIAPQYKDGDFEPQLDVTWRLIWADHRYEDGVIPEEEKDYLPEEGEALATAPTDRYRILPGEACPKTGDWMVGHTPRTRRHFNEGDIMPELNLPNGATIWMLAESGGT